MCAELVAGVMLVVHAPSEPSREEWSHYCDYAGACRRAAQGTLRTLVVTSSDAGPNAGQRGEYKHKVAGSGNRVAVLCAGNVTRTILTAMSWFNPDMKPFALSELDRALSYLGVSRSEPLLQAIQEFRQRLVPQARQNTG